SSSATATSTCATSPGTTSPGRATSCSTRSAATRSRRSWWVGSSGSPPAEPRRRLARGERRHAGSGGALEDVHAAGAAEADDVRQADRGVLDLAVAGLAPQVVADLPDVGDAGRRDGVALRLEAARDVDRQPPVAPGRARLEERDGLALGAQHEVVVV